MSDLELLRDYGRQGSEAAFAELVRRHVGLVYSTALRHVEIAAHAEEITQVVFVILARKAAGLRPGTVLEGWLYEATRLAALAFLRGERRRQWREQQAVMQSTLHETIEQSAWTQLAPLLDEAMGRLGKKDREALILRYFKGKKLGEVALALQLTEVAAQRRVHRAVEKLRRFFSKRGVTSTTAIIAGNISANAVHAAPSALAGLAASAGMAKGAVAGASTLALMHGTLKTMTWAKIKFGCGVAVAVLLSASLVGLSTAFLQCCLQDDRNDRYQIEGRLDYGGRFVRDFTLTVNGTNWAVHLIHVKDPTGSIDWAAAGLKPPPASGIVPPSSEQYDEVVCLNGTIYHYQYYGKLPGNSGGAQIYFGDSALDDDTFADFVWVGLASGYYFHQATNNEVTPLANMGPTEKAMKIRVKAQWQLNDTPPYLPKRIDYLGFPTHGIIVRPDAIIHQFDNGDWTNGEVRVLKETNINGRIFPTDYTYEQFRPNLNNTTKNVEHQLWVTVKVKKIRLHAVPDVLPPETHGETLVNDFRLSISLTLNRRSEQPYYITYGTMYLSTARRLTENPEVVAVQAYKKQLRMLHRPYVPQPGR